MILVKYPTQKEAVAAAQASPPELGRRFCADTSGGKRLIWPPTIPGGLPDIIDTPPPESDPAVLPELLEDELALYLKLEAEACGEEDDITLPAETLESDSRYDEEGARAILRGAREEALASGEGTEIEAEADVSSRFDAFEDDIDPGDAVDDED